ncbi:TPA: transcriptional regulator, partial [Klebsiella oxytoca]
LREAELVIDRREGKWVHYRLSPHMPAWAAGIIDTAWNCERENIRNKLSSVASVSC